jgi:AraC-like DNA-binding protein
MISSRCEPRTASASGRGKFVSAFRDLCRYLVRQPPTLIDVAASLDGRRFLRREFPPELPLRIEHLTFPAYEPPLQRWWLHWHDYYEIIVPLEGAGRFQVGDLEVPFKPGHLMLVESLRLHGGAEVTRTHRSLVIFFPAETIAPPGGPLADRTFLSPLGTRSDGVLPVLDPASPVAARAMRRVGELARAYYESASSDSKYMACKLALLGLLSDLREHFGNSASPDEPQKRAHQQERLHKVLPYLAQHFAEPLTQPEVARVAGMSASRFRAFFKQTTGTTLAGYLRHLRLARVVELLRQSDRPLADIAAETGFADQSHLFRCFRAQFGCGPFDYRRRQRDA